MNLIFLNSYNPERTYMSYFKKRTAMAENIEQKFRLIIGLKS